MTRALRPRLLAAALATSVAVSLTGCSGDGEGTSPSAEPSDSLVEPSEAPTLEAEPVTTSGQIVGRLPRTDRRRAEKGIARVAVRWVEAAYLGGTYPRRNFTKAFPGFTRGARSRARGDLGLMSNKRIAQRISGVSPSAVRVRVDLLAVHRRAVSGTAHVALRFRTEGKLERGHRVIGRLLMTRHGKGWQVFGYDVTRSDTVSGARAKKDRRDRAGKKSKDRRKKDRRKKDGGRG